MGPPPSTSTTSPTSLEIIPTSLRRSTHTKKPARERVFSFLAGAPAALRRFLQQASHMEAMLADHCHAGVIRADPEHPTGTIGVPHHSSDFHLCFTHRTGPSFRDAFLFLTCNFCFFLLRHHKVLRIWSLPALCASGSNDVPVDCAR